MKEGIILIGSDSSRFSRGTGGTYYGHSNFVMPRETVKCDLRPSETGGLHRASGAE